MWKGGGRFSALVVVDVRTLIGESVDRPAARPAPPPPSFAFLLVFFWPFFVVFSFHIDMSKKPFSASR